MAAFWSGSAGDFIAAPEDDLLAAPSRARTGSVRCAGAAPVPAWRDSIDALKAAMMVVGAAGFDAWVLLDYLILRLGKRIDAVVLTDRAIFVLAFKRAPADLDAMRQTEDHALDLLDFHEHSRHHCVVPVLVTDGAAPAVAAGLLLSPGVANVVVLRPEALGPGLVALLRLIGPAAVPLDARRWTIGAYRPVPSIVEAACMLYSRHGVAEIAASRADQRNLHETTQAIRAAIAEARDANEKIVVFVTGIPGAGKTLCGLNAAFTDDAQGGVFLTGNPALVHVLREALARDARDRGAAIRDARRRTETVIQQLPKFRNEYVVNDTHVPPERVVVIDEAQRCWSREYAVRKTRDKDVRLRESEPGVLLDIMARHDGFAAMICLVGGGQEIHDGEGGLAEWGAALRARPAWRVMAAPDDASPGDPRRKLGPLPGLTMSGLLHLDVPVRQIRSVQAADWVDAVLRGQAGKACGIAEHAGGVPFWLVRDVDGLRAALRDLARGERRAGLLASSGAKRLRAEGLGAELPHMDEAAVANWFLDRFPADVRASDALEQVATEFSCQGLELDYVGLCWDADLIRSGDGSAWVARKFKGTAWQAVHKAEAAANRMNSYRVLLTRARYDTVIYVPRGDARDATRDPAVYGAVAAFLSACGVREYLPGARARAAAPAMAEAVLL